MPFELKIPNIGESVTEATVSRWIKKIGERIERDEPVVELDTDKVTVELPAPEAGVLSKILLEEGQTAEIGAVIALMEAGEGEQTAAPAAAPLESKSGSKSDSEQTLAADATAAPLSSPSAGAGHVMPAAQRLLKQHRLDASQVPATGPGGRLLKEDVERQATHDATQSAGERLEELVPMSPIRRRIAQRLVEAQSNAALLTTFNEVDMSAVVALRRSYKEAFLAKHGIKLGFMSFFVKACVDALRQIPQLNAEITGTDILYRDYFDIGIAVSTPKGLMVPVLRSTERQSFAEIERGIHDFGTRARDGKIKLQDLQGGTFTISNGGIFGSMLSTPIVNPPQSGVLGLHAIEDRPVAREGAVVIRPMMYLALTYDHRIVDGREAVTFLKRIKDTIEEPSRLLLEV